MAYGFGGKLPNVQVSHCFALNGNSVNPNCTGIEGVLQAYRQALNNVQLWGPTWFSEVIRSCSAIALESDARQRQEQKYYVLLIITDGAINDMAATVDAIVSACSLPLSIVIVGVGNADFASMNALDGDDGQLRNSAGLFASRDIVQFVPFNKYNNTNYQELARETLAEIPRQLTEYFKKKGIKPQGA